MSISPKLVHICLKVVFMLVVDFSELEIRSDEFWRSSFLRLSSLHSPKSCQFFWVTQILPNNLAGHRFSKPTGPYWPVLARTGPNGAKSAFGPALMLSPDFVDFITWSNNWDCRFSYHFKTSFCVRSHCLILNRYTWSTLLLYSDYDSLWMLFSFWTSKNPGKALEKTVKQPWKTLEFLISEDLRTLYYQSINTSNTYKKHL